VLDSALDAVVALIDMIAFQCGRQMQHPQFSQHAAPSAATMRQIQQLAASDDVQWVLSQGLAEAARQLHVQHEGLSPAAADSSTSSSSSSSRIKVVPLHNRLFESLGTAALVEGPQRLTEWLPRTLDDEVDVLDALTACLSCQLVTVPSNSSSSSSSSRVKHITATVLLRRLAVQLEVCCLQPDAVTQQLGLQALVKTRSDLFHQIVADNPDLDAVAAEEKTDGALSSLIPSMLKQLLPAFLYAMQRADLHKAESGAAGASMGLLMSRLLTSELRNHTALQNSAARMHPCATCGVLMMRTPRAPPRLR
jgi:hypothetical protein